MEDKENPTWEYFEEEELESHDNLSFCNFSMQDNKEISSVVQSPRNSSAEEFFEFYNTKMSPSTAPDIIFCGKIIHEDQDVRDLNEYQKRDYLTMVRSKSFHRPASCYEYPFFDEEKDVFPSKDRPSSSSLRFMNSQSAKHSTNNYQIQKVNITSLTSMSAKSRRRMFMFGPVKFKPEMELSALKERQGRRRVPTTIFPAPVMDGAEKNVVSGAGGINGKQRGKSQWGMVMRSLRGSSHLTTVLAKSLGCICLTNYFEIQ